MKKQLISFDWAIRNLLRNKANFAILDGFLSELIAPDKDLKIIKLLESESNKNSEIKPDFHAKGLLKAKQELDILNLPAEERNT